MSQSEGVVTFGETMALMANERPGPLSVARTLNLGIGGAESNLAIALSRLDTPVTWLGRVGADSLGDLVLREIAGEGVTTIGIRDGEAPTGLMIKERRLPHRQRVWYYRRQSAGSRLTPDDLPLDLIRRAQLLHVTGITPALSASAAATVSAALGYARTSATLVSFDVNYRSTLWSPAVAGPQLRELITQADIVFAGADEAALVVGSAGDPLDLAYRIAELGPREVIIKLGGDGCLALVDGAPSQRAAIPIEVIDSVGAGDAFVAGYLAERLSDEPVERRLETAVRAGAFACLVPGDWEGMPRRTELDLLDGAEPVLR